MNAFRKRSAFSAHFLTAAKILRIHCLNRKKLIQCYKDVRKGDCFMSLPKPDEQYLPFLPTMEDGSMDSIKEGKDAIARKLDPREDG